MSQKDSVLEPGEQTLEQVFEEMEALIEKMEEGLPLEDTFSLYRRGMDMLKTCSDKIDKVEKQMLVLDEGGQTHVF